MSIKLNGHVNTKCAAVQGDFPAPVGTVNRVKASQLFKLYKPYYANRGEGPEGMDTARVMRIAKSIIGTEAIGSNYTGTYWLVNPIIVRKKPNEKGGTIVDGHYTATALHKVLELTGWDLEVLVIEREFPKNLSDMEIVSMFNNSRKAWAAEQYIECYVKEGKEDYIKLKEAALKLGGPFVKKNGKPNYRYVSALLGSSQSGTLKKGTFTYNPSIVERGERVKELFYAISKTKQTSSWFEPFIIAYVKLEDNAPLAFEVCMRNANEFVLDGCTNEEGWTEQFKKVYMSHVKVV